MHKCTSCGYTAEEMGQCPSCNIDLIAEETAETTEEIAPEAETEVTEAAEETASEEEAAETTEEAAPEEGGEVSEEVSDEPKEEGSAM